MAVRSATERKYRIVTRTVSVFILLALLLSAGLGRVIGQDFPLAQRSPPVAMRVNGQTIILELGKNVHPQAYALLLRDPDFASQVERLRPLLY